VFYAVHMMLWNFLFKRLRCELRCHKHRALTTAIKCGGDEKIVKLLLEHKALPHLLSDSNVTDL